MKNTIGSIKNDNSRDLYWVNVIFESEKGPKKISKLYIAASHEYLWNHFETQQLEELRVKEWFNNIIKKWIAMGDVMLDIPVQYDTYMTTPEGKESALFFLKSLES